MKKPDLLKGPVSLSIGGWIIHFAYDPSWGVLYSENPCSRKSGSFGLFCLPKHQASLSFVQQKSPDASHQGFSE